MSVRIVVAADIAAQLRDLADRIDAEGLDAAQWDVERNIRQLGLRINRRFDRYSIRLEVPRKPKSRKM